MCVCGVVLCSADHSTAGTQWNVHRVPLSNVVEVLFYLLPLQLPRGHRIVLLHLLEKVCKNHIHDLEEPLANDLIELASTELTKDPVSQCFICMYNSHVQCTCIC